MRILVVHQYYLMAGFPGGSRFNEFARFWSEAGHEVTVVAGNLDYSTATVPERYRGKWVTKERDGAVEVWRCHVPRTYLRGPAGRAWAFFGFTLSAMTAALRAKKPDVVIATSPPLIAVIPGWAAAHMHGKVPWVFEVRDLWPESGITLGVLKKDAAVTKVLYALERWASASADRVNVLTPAFREDVVRRGLADDAKVLFVPNGADTERFTPGPRENDVRRELGWGEKFVAMYAGAHSRANAIGQLVDAAEALRDRPEGKDVLIACVGDGTERKRWEEEAKRRGLPNIVFYGPQAKDRMPEFVRACDVGMAVLARNPTFKTVYPNKVFDAMACGRPCLVAIDGVAKKLVCDDARAGVFAEPEDGKGIAEALVKMAGDPLGCREMGERGRAWVLENATREGLAKRYLEALGKLVAEAGSADG